MTSNPLLNNSRIEENIISDSKPMTVQGTVNKTILLLAIVIGVSLFSWNICAQGFADKANLLSIIGAIGGFILAMIGFFNPKSSPITAPCYAICEGLVVGSVSFMYNQFYEGIIPQAAGITLLTLFAMLLLYKAKVIQATEKFRKVIFTATLAIAIYYGVAFIASLLGHPMTVFGTTAGIVISLVICAIAALNFILDFDFVEKASNSMVPNYFEWYAGLSLLVTVIWLYFEILRLLAQLSRRN